MTAKKKTPTAAKPASKQPAPEGKGKKAKASAQDAPPPAVAQPAATDAAPASPELHPAFNQAGEQVMVSVPPSDNGEAVAPSAAPAKGGKKEKAPKAQKPAKSPNPAKPPRTKRVSALDAAAQVIAGSKEPMRATDMIAAMETKGLWKSPGGKTPEATLYAAIIREISAKGKEARFAKHDRGLFVAGATPTPAGKGA